jgi:hypothetical protein
MTETNSRRGRLNRRRGKEAEKDAAEFNCGVWGVDLAHSAQWTQREPDNLYLDCPGEGYYVSVKHEELWRPHDYIRDAEKRSGGAPWWVQMRRPRALPWRAFGSVWYNLMAERTLLDVLDDAYGHTFPFAPTASPQVPIEERRRRVVVGVPLMVDIHGFPDDRQWRLVEWTTSLEALEGRPYLGWVLWLRETPERVYAVTSGGFWAVSLLRAWRVRRRDSEC